ncbi:hypothetical protein BHE74_00006981 [Ensete ventricosum]|nr:hypothetical protein BHE74_00006981 [Ensete ventricosum]RZS00067.1 hypothetical protein BHM03_00029750 [Ensete ventricosum]
MQVKACSMPRLPGYKELLSDLGPIYARLSCENSIAKRHPVYKCSEVQVFSCLKAAGQFLNAVRRYLESLCSNLRSHTITNLFVETQLFSVLSDSRLSRYENE